MIFSLWRALLKEAYFKPQKHFKELFAYETENDLLALTSSQT